MISLVSLVSPGLPNNLGASLLGTQDKGDCGVPTLTPPTSSKDSPQLSLPLLLGSCSEWTPLLCLQLSKPGARVHPPLLPQQLLPAPSYTQPHPISYHPISWELESPFRSAPAMACIQLPVSSHPDPSNSLLTALWACLILPPSDPLPAT